MNIPPFKLYGLIGCPHCVDAEKFLSGRGIPFLLMLASNDPIIEEGVKKILNVEKAEYPILLCSITTPLQIVRGFNKVEYERLANLFFEMRSTSAASVFNSEQQSSPTLSSTD